MGIKYGDKTERGNQCGADFLFLFFMNIRFISYSASKKSIYRCAAPTFFFSMLFYKDFGALHLNN